MDEKDKDFNDKYKQISDTIRLYPMQLKQSWDEIQNISIPEDFKNADNIVFCGMGGSALGARIIDSLFFDVLRIPLEIFNGYKVPNYTSKKSLVIISSYSGSTEETIECLYSAQKKNANIFVITTGGKLEEIIKTENIKSYVYDPVYNPSKQPRMAIFYSIGSLLGLLNKLGFITLTKEDIENSILSMNNLLTEFNENIDTNNNLPKFYADQIKLKSPVLITSEHLYGSAYVFKNQINECAKTFSYLFELPELNHHLMEGLQHPSKLNNLLTFIFFESDLFSENIKKRYKLTQEVVEKNGYELLSYKLISPTKLEQAFELIIFGSFCVYHLTKLYKIDPLIIPWVDYFKKKLSS